MRPQGLQRRGCCRSRFGATAAVSDAVGGVTGAVQGAAGGAKTPPPIDPDQVVEIVERRLLREIERRGGRWAGVF